MTTATDERSALGAFSRSLYPSFAHSHQYGTIIGQYMTSLLPPHRLGKVVLDGVVKFVLSTSPHSSAC